MIPRVSAVRGRMTGTVCFLPFAASVRLRPRTIRFHASYHPRRLCECPNCRKRYENNNRPINSALPNCFAVHPYQHSFAAYRASCSVFHSNHLRFIGFRVPGHHIVDRPLVFPGIIPLSVLLRRNLPCVDSVHHPTERRFLFAGIIPLTIIMR